MVSTLHLVQCVKFKVRINERWQHKCDPERDRGFWHRRGIIDGRIDMRCQLFSLAANGWIAEEPESWDWTSACKGALLQPLQSMFWSHLALPDRRRHKSDRPWHRGLPPTLFEQCNGFFYVPFQLQYKDEGDKANGLTTPPNDAIIWTEKGVSMLAWSHQYFKELGWWSGRVLNSRPPAQQTGALPTELTGQRRLEGAVTLWISASTHQLMDCIFSLH